MRTGSARYVRYSFPKFSKFWPKPLYRTCGKPVLCFRPVIIAKVICPSTQRWKDMKVCLPRTVHNLHPLTWFQDANNYWSRHCYHYCHHRSVGREGYAQGLNAVFMRPPALPDDPGSFHHLPLHLLALQGSAHTNTLRADYCVVSTPSFVYCNLLSMPCSGGRRILCHRFSSLSVSQACVPSV